MTFLRISPAAPVLTLGLILAGTTGLAQSARGPLFFEGFEDSLARRWHFGINGDNDPYIYTAQQTLSQGSHLVTVE